MSKTVGIKIANGEYYPILDDTALSKKKLILTTVHDEQESVQIDLYQGKGQEIADAKYIGSLLIEDIDSGSKGSPEIELIIGVDEDGNLHASAGDIATGEHQSLSVSLETLDSSTIYDTADFELDDDIGYNEPLSSEEETQLTQDFEEDFVEEKPRKLSLLKPLLLLVAFALIALLVFFLLRGCETDDAAVKPPLQAEERVETEAPVAVQQPEAEEQHDEAAVETEEDAAADSGEPEKTSSSMRVSDEGVWYHIKWGDTLWDLSISFYRTPWLYWKIAKANNIKNPDLIYAWTDIFIPAE